MLKRNLYKEMGIVVLCIAVLVLATMLPPHSVAGQARQDDSDQSDRQGKITRKWTAPEPKTEQAGKFQAQTRRERPDWVERAYQKSLAHLRQQTEIREKLEPETDLRLVEAQQDDLGITQLRLEQTRNKVEVFGGQLLSYLRGEEVQEPMGRIFEIAGIDVTPYLTAEQAIEIAKGVLGYAQQFAELPTAKLVVLPHQIINHESGPGATLTWQVELRIEDGTEATAHHRYFIDARNGSLVWHYNNMPTATGTGHSLYRGTVALSTSTYSSGYVLVDGQRGNAATADVYNREDATGGDVFFSANNVWGDGTASNRQSAAVDAHYGAMKTWDYYLEVFGRRGIDANGYRVISRVHYGSNVNNAYWNGYGMLYGDGDGVEFSPFVALDVVGHEITHGLTQRTANLIYANESGAANESFSDIFGTAIEFYASGNGNYLLGEDFTTPGVDGDAGRSMADPTLYRQPDHYSDLYTGSEDNGGVHINSGIQNKAFYLMAEGGTHPRSRIQVPAIGRRVAERIFYRALTQYLSPSARFLDVAQATLRAAADLHGSNSSQYQATRRAWEAVGVLEPAPCTDCGTGSCNAQALSCGANVSGSLATGDCTQGKRGSDYLTDNFQFSGSAGQTVTIDLSSSAFDAYLYLVSPSGSVAAQDDDGGDGRNSRISFTLPSSGNWKIEVTSYGKRATGAYSLSLAGCSGSGGGGGGSCQAQTISCPVSGSANLASSDCSQGNRPNRFSDIYQFSGSAGQTVTINMASSAFDTYLYLISPSGSVAAEDDDSGGEGNSRIRFTLPSSGNWKIEATSYRERQTGTYTLALEGCGSGGGGTGGGGTPITWDTNATSARGRNGERFALTCPANGSPGSIWGTDVYTDDSPICTAAVHAGLITVRSGGTVTLEIRPGQSSYTGSLRNGVNSQSWGSWHGSYVFVR